MLLRGLALFVCLFGFAVSADVSLGKFKTLETRFGKIGVVWAPEGTESVLWNTQPIPDLVTAEITIAGAYALADEPFDWVVLETRHNGNMCPYAFVLLQVGQAGIRRTSQFGDCLGEVKDLRVLPGRIELDIGDSDIRYSHQVFSFDGVKLTQTPILAAAATAPPGVGVAVERWTGKALFEVLREPEEVARFSAIMRPELLEDLRLATSLPVASQRVGDWVIGTGCQQHMCGFVAGLWAIRISDGAPFGAFVYGDGSPPVMVGDQSLLGDPNLSNALTQLISKMQR